MLIVLNAKRYYLDIGIYNERGISLEIGGYNYGRF